MITELQRTTLRHFFAAYFHQDWMHTEGTVERVIESYAADVRDPTAFDTVVEGIAALIADHPDDDALSESLFRQFSCYYSPKAVGDSTARWLREVAERVRAAGERHVIVDFRVDLVNEWGTEELDERHLGFQIADGDIDALRDAPALAGVLRIGVVEIADELTTAVQRLCFDAPVALVVDGAAYEYRVRVVAAGDQATIALGDAAARTCSRPHLLRALVACGDRWLAALEALGRTGDAARLRPLAEAAHAALTASGLAEPSGANAG